MQKKSNARVKICKRRRATYKASPTGHTVGEVIALKKKDGGLAPATPAVPDPPVPNRARTEMKLGDPPSREEKK